MRKSAATGRLFSAGRFRGRRNSADRSPRSGRQPLSRPVWAPAPAWWGPLRGPVHSGRFGVDRKPPPEKRPSPLPLSENRVGGALFGTAARRALPAARWRESPSAEGAQPGRYTGGEDHRQSVKRPAKLRSGRSALVMMPGRAATTDRRECRAGIPVTVMPMEAKLAGSDRSTPLRGKTMCLL